MCSSNPGKGCRIDITLPAPPQVEQVLALRAGSWRVAIPARSLETVRRISAAVADQALAQGVLQDKAAAPLPIYWAGAVWHNPSRSLEPPLDGQRSLPIVRGDTARWGVIVDEVLGTQEVTLQAPADLEVPIPGLLGTAAQPSGQVLQVYEPTAVLSAHETRLRTGTMPRRLWRSHTTRTRAPPGFAGRRFHECAPPGAAPAASQWLPRRHRCRRVSKPCNCWKKAICQRC